MLKSIISKRLVQGVQRRMVYGVCFDIDGVLAKGPDVIPGANTAFKKLLDSHGRWNVPVAFVTNSSVCSKSRADYLSELLNVKINPENVVQAHSPLLLMSHLSDIFCLLVGQGNVKELANEVGLKKVCTIEDLQDAYPLLDMVDAGNKYKNIDFNRLPKDFPRVEAIILLGESIRWETTLQLVVDLLRTNGLPTKLPSHASTYDQLPLIACNFDLEYMGRAAIPRFGHGAFLVCIEALYKKATGHSLKYTSLIGKPAEVTFRYAETVLNKEAKKLGRQLKTMYMVGDVPEADIAGANLYQRYIRKLEKYRKLGNDEEECINLVNLELPPSRNIPFHPLIVEQSVRKVESLLVCTGVYKKGSRIISQDSHVHHNRSIDALNFDKSVEEPTKIFHDVSEAIDYIIKQNSV